MKQDEARLTAATIDRRRSGVFRSDSILHRTFLVAGASEAECENSRTVALFYAD